jgi:hypothetical protein
VFGSKSWDETIPTSEASTWYCKYKIVAASSLISDPDPEKRGYIYLEIEAYSFDEEIFLNV